MSKTYRECLESKYSYLAREIATLRQLTSEAFDGANTEHRRELTDDEAVELAAHAEDIRTVARELHTSFLSLIIDRLVDSN